MEIYVLDLNANILDVIDNYKSCIWTMQWFGQGEFELVVPATQEYVNLLQENRLLCKSTYRTENGFVNVMQIKKIVISSDWENGNTITVTGKGLKNIVGNRIIWQQINQKGNIESSIRQIITENIIKPGNTERKIPNFVLGKVAGITEVVELQLLGENIAEWLESIGNTYNFGWDVAIEKGKFVFELSKGTNRSYGQKDVTPVVFSPEYDNFLTSNYTKDYSEFKNAALIGGEGEGVNQRTASIGEASGLERYEMYIDGSSVSSNGAIITVEQYMKLLRDYGKDQLNATYNDGFDGNLIHDGNFGLNEDYFLGDVVQVQNEYGISATPHIIEIIESEDENGITTVPTFSTWEV